MSVLALTPLSPTWARAQDVSILISRNAEVTTVYLSAPAALLDDADSLTAISPTFAHAQLAATTHMACIAGAFSLLVTNGQAVPVRSRPAVVHNATDPLPFSDPFDASLSTVVCATPRAALPPIDALRLYTSFVAEAPVDLPLPALTLPAGNAGARPVALRIFLRGQLVSDSIAMPSAAGILSLKPTPDRRWADAVGPGVILLGVMMAVWAAWRALVLSRSRKSASHAR
jgi:hypothetical protein